MNLDFNLKLTQEQRLIMTQQMQLSIKLLQMSSYELKEFIDKEFVENPILEASFDETNDEKKQRDKLDYKELIKYLEFDNYGSQSYGDYDNEDVSPFNFISEKQTLTEYLQHQIMELDEDEYIKSIVGYMIENLDHRGYLSVSMWEICEELQLTEAMGEEALEVLQELDPDGIGARNLEECLKIQLRKQGILDDILESMIDNHLNDVADNKFTYVAKKLNITPKEAQDNGDIIKKLEPKPSRGFFTGEDVKFIIPDAQIRKIDGQYFVIMNEGIIPKLSISNLYKQVLNDDKDKKTEEYVKEKMNSAIFLIKSVEQRKGTLQKVLEKIVEKQTEYFDKGEVALKAMTLKEVADELSIHESTVSRAIKDKFVLTANGTKRIKDLFTTALPGNGGEQEDITVINIKKKIKELIEAENKQKPMSDQGICDELKNNGMNISRRTVAKYREELGIQSSSKRKRI